MDVFTCTRCGMSTTYQSHNPYPVSHPLGRTCGECLPLLLTTGRSTQALIAEWAAFRRDETIPGGRYYTASGKLINANGERINEDGSPLAYDGMLNSPGCEGMLIPYPEMEM